MAGNQLHENLQKLQQWVDFAEGKDVAPSLVVRVDGRLVTIGSAGLQRIAAMRADQTDMVRAEVRHIIRQLAAGDHAVTVFPPRVGYLLIRHTTPARQQGVSVTIDGEQPRDMLVYLLVCLLKTVALDHLRLCPAADCGKAFVKVTKKRYCSSTCQSRDYMRTFRAKEKAERDAFLRKGSRVRR